MADLDTFFYVYSILKSELLHDPDFKFSNDSRQWVERMLDYNVIGGKLNRGLSVIDSYTLLKDGEELNDDEIFLASTLAWCVEWLQASFIVVDDIMDNAHTRRGQPCWFRVPKVACALLLLGENLDNHINVKNILVEMGTFFQAQDDYLDCFGAPEIIGKIGTDIEDFKCSWLVVKALELSNEEQKKVLYENYGKPDPTNISRVKALYNELNLQGVFAEHESSSYEKLLASIEAHPSKAVQATLKSFLAKIYKRQK